MQCREEVLTRIDAAHLLKHSLHMCLMFARPQADRFVRTGRTLRRRMWWQNCKMKLVIAFAVVLLAVIIFLLVCFSGELPVISVSMTML
jgi:uncharacterized membrane protein YidH (DUF202 family)